MAGIKGKQWKKKNRKEIKFMKKFFGKMKLRKIDKEIDKARKNWISGKMSGEDYRKYEDEMIEKYVNLKMSLGL